MSDRERGDSGSAQPADAVGTPAPASISGKRTLLDPPDPTEPKKVGQQSLVTATFGHGAHAAAPVARANPTAPAIPELPPPAAPAPGAPVMQLRSTDPRINGRTAADVSHQLKLDLLDLAQHANRMVDGMAMEEQSLAHDRTSDPVGTWLDATAGPHADTPTTFEPVMWELLAFAGHAIAHTRAPGDAANLRALAADDVADHDRFRALASRSSALWDALEDDAKAKMHALGHVLTAVNAIKDADFAAAVIVAGMVAAPLAAGGTSSVGGFGVGALGGGLVGAGLHAADLTDDKHSTAARTWSGFVDGALMAPTAALGGAAGQAARAGLARISAGIADTFVGAAVEGAANGAVMSDSYDTATSIAGGNDVGTAMKAGLRGAAIGAPFGAVMGAALEHVAARSGTLDAEPHDRRAAPEANTKSDESAVASRTTDASTSHVDASDLDASATAQHAMAPDAAQSTNASPARPKRALPHQILSPDEEAALQAKVKNRTITKDEWERLQFNRRLKNRRARGVDRFWARERRRLRSGEPGTRTWTPEQRADILAGRTPKYDGESMQGHHKHNVADHADIADQGDNIYPTTRDEHLNRWHGGSFQNDTEGDPLNPDYEEDF